MVRLPIPREPGHSYLSMNPCHNVITNIGLAFTLTFRSFTET